MIIVPKGYTKKMCMTVVNNNHIMLHFGKKKIPKVFFVLVPPFVEGKELTDSGDFTCRIKVYYSDCWRQEEVSTHQRFKKFILEDIGDEYEKISINSIKRIPLKGFVVEI